MDDEKKNSKALPPRRHKFKMQLYKDLDNLKKEVEKTSHLVEVYDNQWFDELKKIIDNFTDQPIFETKTHALFIAFWHTKFLQPGRNIVKELDHYYGLIKNEIGTHRIRSLRDKKGRFGSKNFPNYLGTVYETVIIGKFVEEGYLKEYEPFIQGTTNKAEALVEMAGQSILIEATVFQPKEELPGVWFGVRSHIALKLSIKLREKVDKLQNVKSPVILFVNTPAHKITNDEVLKAIEIVQKDSPFESISTVIISFYYLADNNYIYNNPIAKNPLNNKTYCQLRKMFNLEELKPL